MPFYDHDLAAIHDRAFTGLAAHAAPTIIRLLHEHALSGHVVDLGCGSGTLAATLCNHGFSSTGIDVSPAMIKLASQRAPQADFVCASFHDAPIPPCSAIVSIGECLNYFQAAREAPSLSTLLQRIHDALTPRGIFIFDVALPGRAGPSATRTSARVTDDWAILAVETEREHRLERRITTFTRTSDNLYRRTDENHHLALTPPDDLLAMLGAAGFDARRLAGADDYTSLHFPTAYAAFLARRSE